MTQQRGRRWNPPGRDQYRTRQFAGIAGVTVKTLLHYDRLGLLAPTRTSAGHRLYSSRDLERLRHILALKRVGIALGRMRRLLDASPAALRTQLELSRQELAQDRQRIDRADRAVAHVLEGFDTRRMMTGRP